MIFFKMNNWRLLPLLLVATCLHLTLMRAQLLDCNFQEVDLLPCLTKTSESTTEACCLALNQTLKTAHHCLCSLLPYSNLQLASVSTLFTVSPLALMFPGCALISPSLAACEVPLELNSPPVPTKEPVLTPMAAAPAQRPMSPSTNSTQMPIEEPQQEKGVPRTRENQGPSFGYNRYSGSTGTRLHMYKSLTPLVWLVAISACIM